MDTIVQTGWSSVESAEFLSLTGTYYVEFYVGNAKQAAHILKHGDGVKVLALGVKDAYGAFEETVKRSARERGRRIKGLWSLWKKIINSCRTGRYSMQRSFLM